MQVDNLCTSRPPVEAALAPSAWRGNSALETQVAVLRALQVCTLTRLCREKKRLKRVMFDICFFNGSGLYKAIAGAGSCLSCSDIGQGESLRVPQCVLMLCRCSFASSSVLIAYIILTDEL